MSEYNNQTNSSESPKSKRTIDKTDPTTVMKLHKATEKLALDEVTNLLENFTFCDKVLNTSLIKAINAYRISGEAQDIINCLLSYDADPNCLISIVPSTICQGKNEKTTAFMFAATKGDLILVDLILKYKTNINQKDTLGRNAIFYAIAAEKGDNADLIMRLIEEGINVNDIESNEGNSPLILATVKNMKDTVKCLLESKASPDIQNFQGNTALHYAILNNSLEAINLLISHRANLKILNKDQLTSINLAIKLNKTNIYEILAKEQNAREINEQSIFKELEDNANTKFNTDKSKMNFYNLNSYDNKVMTSDSANMNQARAQTQGQTYQSINIPQGAVIKENMSILPTATVIGTVMTMTDQKKTNPYDGFINKSSSYDASHPDNMNLSNSPEQSQPSSQSAATEQTQPHKSLSGTNIPHVMQVQPGYLNNNNDYNTLQNEYLQMNNLNYLQGNINQLSNSMQNINININNIPITKYSKKFSSKIRSTKSNLSKKTFNEKLSQNIYNYPEARLNNSKIEIPFNFNKIMPKQNNLHSYIKMQNLPNLTIDISNDGLENHLIFNNQLLEFKERNLEMMKKMILQESKLKLITEENAKLQNVNQELVYQLVEKDKEKVTLLDEYRTKDEAQKDKIIELQSKLDDVEGKNFILYDKVEKLDKELSDQKLKKNHDENLFAVDKFSSSSSNKPEKKKDKEIQRKEYLEKKFNLVKYDVKFISKCLQKDIIDFQEYNRETIKKLKPLQEDLIKLVQDSINEVIGDFEVKLYGSHATNLCLPWSDLDIVLVNKKNYNAYNFETLSSIYYNLKDKPWKHTIKFINSAAIPIIKITTTELFQSIQIDISMQDNKHYGLKCVELVKTFMKEYEALEPLIFSLKNILKNANLNDPYTGGLSSYGLILMVVSFLQNQLEHKKKITITDWNLGNLFIEFLFYYGWMFDHTKYVIYAYPPNDNNHLDKESLSTNLFYSNQLSQNELVIMDPLSKSNNVARSTYQFGNIKMAFMLGYVVSHEECECGCHYTNTCNDIISNVTNSEHCILKRIFNSVKRFNGNNPVIGNI